MKTKSRVLVIRGGAIGDFILTLPALRLIRDNIPGCHLEVLGYPGIADLAEKAGLADAVRSLEHRTMALLFAKGAPIDADLAAYLCSFNLVVSYLYDPDGHFRSSLERVGVKTLIECSHRVEPERGHAAAQLAKPLERLAMFLEDPAPRLFPGRAYALPDDDSKTDRLKPALQREPWTPLRWSAGFSLSDIASAVPSRPSETKSASLDDKSIRIAIHPGSGSELKNWPLTNWLQLAGAIRTEYPAANVCFITGEAEAERGMLEPVRKTAAALGSEVWHGLPLAVLADRLATCNLFLGHDSGISHLAAACGARCLLLFGPTDPGTWAPANPGVIIVRGVDADMASISLDAVRTALQKALCW